MNPFSFDQLLRNSSRDILQRTPQSNPPSHAPSLGTPLPRNRTLKQQRGRYEGANRERDERVEQTRAARLEQREEEALAVQRSWGNVVVRRPGTTQGGPTHVGWIPLETETVSHGDVVVVIRRAVIVMMDLERKRVSPHGENKLCSMRSSLSLLFQVILISGDTLLHHEKIVRERNY